MSTTEPIPVILDTDIGTDIDDTWALALLLRSPELDVRLITTATGDTRYRARLVARLLEVAGRTDIPIGVGRAWGEFACSQDAWAAPYPLEQYPGPVHEDAAGAIVETIMGSAQPVTLIAIGPLTNIADALKREPHIATHTRFVSMAGSIAKNFDNAEGAIAEWNVVQDLPASQQVFSAPWQAVCLVPLDACGSLRLPGEAVRAMAQSDSPLARAVVENYLAWLDSFNVPPEERASSWLAGQPEQRTSILYDTVAVYLAYGHEYLSLPEMTIRVDDAGFTCPDPAGMPMTVALAWTDLPGFQQFLCERLLGYASYR